MGQALQGRHGSVRSGGQGVPGYGVVSYGVVDYDVRGYDGPGYGVVVGQVMRIRPPFSPSMTSTSSTRPLMTARPI
ncbi:MAG: hypothetical protein QOF84_2432 [Streptomyces sp.]|nr:hypothetical protein [Streptomyces sp.]